MPRAPFYDLNSTESQPFYADFFTYQGQTAPDQPGRRANLRNKILSKIQDLSGMVVQDSISSTANYYGQTIIEDSVPSYEPLITEHYVRRLPSNSPFDKRKRNGEVVLSAAEHGRVQVKSYPGIEPRDHFGSNAGKYVDGWFCEQYLGFTRVRLWSSWFWVDPSDSSVIISNIGMNVLYKLWNQAVSVPPIQLTAETVYAMVMKSNEVDTAFVTSMVADANKRLLDLLTVLAETPESLRSVMQLLGTVKNIVVGVKRRQFSLTQSFADRKEYLKRKRDEDLTKLDRMRQELAEEVSARRLSRRVANRRRRMLERDLERTNKSYTRAMKQSGIEFNDAMAGVWMNFRYNIMPLVYTAIDITEAITKDPEFLTVRDGVEKHRSIVLPSDLPALEFTSTFNVFIRDRAKADVGPFSLTSKVVTGNILTTAWELVPLSFVVDWFINVGDFVSAFSGGSTADRSSTLSFKSVLDYTGKDSSNRRVVISGQLWNREVTGSLQQFTCLTFEPDMNPYRYTDSIALTWNALRGDLKRSIR